MVIGNKATRRPAVVARVLASTVLTGTIVFAALDNAKALDQPPQRAGAVHAGRGPVAMRPLVVHRTRRGLPAGPVVVRRDIEPGVDDFVFRDWNETRLNRWGPFRLGGNVFYGDGRGDPINYGNAGLAQIAGYGGARGGFGGPHFDSVGGFHPGPGPDYQESLDYASGRIWTPDIEGPVPHYPGVKAQVAALNQGVVPAGSTRIRYAAGAPRARAVPALPPPSLRTDDDDGDDEGSVVGRAARPATLDDMVPGLDLGGDLF